MVFIPAVGPGGFAGFRLVERSAARQQAAFNRQPEIQRNVDYFRANIANVTSAEDLVRDRRLLTVALAAFGLSEEVNKQAFVQRVLEGGTTEGDALARRLGDPRYLEFARAFGFGDEIGGSSVGVSNVLRPAFRDDIVQRYQQLEFERAVGNVDTDIRLALNFRREIAALSRSEDADEIGVLRVLGNRPLQEFVTSALGLPSSLARLDVDRQQEIVENGLRRVFGESSITVFQDEANVESAVRRFFAIRQAQAGPTASTPGAGAITLLQNAALGGANLFLSQI